MLIRVNTHLEKLLSKANMDKDMLRHMKNHYCARMHVCKAKMKVLKARLAKALNRRKRPDPLQILAESTLKEHGAQWYTPISKFRKFGAILVNFEFFFAKNRFLPSTCSAPRTTLNMGRSISQKIYIFGFFMTNYTCSATAKTFHGDLSPQKVKKQEKNDLFPLFGHTGSSLGRLHFWRGKWPPNWEIPLGLESRHPDLSNKPTCASFECHEVPQKWAQRRAMRWEMACYASGHFLNFSPSAQENATLTSFEFLVGFFILFDVIDVISCWNDTFLPILEDSFIKWQRINEWIGFLAYRGKLFWLPRL